MVYRDVLWEDFAHAIKKPKSMGIWDTIPLPVALNFTSFAFCGAT